MSSIVNLEIGIIDLNFSRSFDNLVLGGKRHSLAVNSGQRTMVVFRVGVTERIVSTRRGYPAFHSHLAEVLLGFTLGANGVHLL